MLKIMRIKGISRSESTNFGFDYKLKDGLNLISSEINTRGKSSAILAIYYCLGFEEIVGGRGMKTLTAVYKSVVEDEFERQHNVLESEAWIEITNGADTITLMRTGKMLGRNENLITVYYSNMDNAFYSEVYTEDFYVHAQRSTTSAKGFHAFLEKFIGFDLPRVPTNDDAEYKLYMQLLFSGIFIEQKRGWADLFSAMPILNIKDAKKRVVEYLLGLDTLANEKRRVALKFSESNIGGRWSNVINDIKSQCVRENCHIDGLPLNPRIWSSEIDEQILVTVLWRDSESLDSALAALELERDRSTVTTPKIIDNYDQLQEELHKTENSIRVFEDELDKQRELIVIEKVAVNKLETSLEIINGDLRNNKDALKLKQMGSALNIDSYGGICPVCHQQIVDSLLPIQSNDHIMSIEDNIKHLESQKTMIQFAMDSHRKNREIAEENIQSLTGRVFTLRRLAKTIRNDLYSVDENLSEAVVYRRIQIENEIRQLSSLKECVSQKIAMLRDLSAEWKLHLAEKSLLPKSNFSESDKIKVDALERYFKKYLRAFNYRSVANYDAIQISVDSYLPVSEGFDMKFDSSASDNIRAIWAYTLALLRTSIENGGNHPQIVLFDEPAQHSIVTDDVISLFNEIVHIRGNMQVILGITLNDGDIRKAVGEFDKSKMHVISVGNHAFRLL